MIHVQLNINWINSCTISRFINHTFWYTLYVTSPSKSVHLGVLELVWKCAICTINVHFHTKLTAPKLTLVLGGTTYDIWSYYMRGKYLGFTLSSTEGRLSRIADWTGISEGFSLLSMYMYCAIQHYIPAFPQFNLNTFYGIGGLLSSREGSFSSLLCCFWYHYLHNG